MDKIVVRNMKMVVTAALAAMLLGTTLAATAASAQDVDPVRLDKRVSRLEGEMRGVQRKVFPGGGDKPYFEPEISAPAAAAPVAIGTPATEPLLDLAQRVGGLESQLRTLTGQIEALQFKQRQLEDVQTRMKGDIEFRVTALEAKTGGIAAATPDAAAAAAPAPALPAKPGARPAPAKPDVVARPATPDAAWKAAYGHVIAKDWPATETAMADFIGAFPKSPRLPQAQYWLGRSHAERGQNAEAARAYLELYKTAPNSDRAPDGLIGLAGALNGLKKPKDACRVLGELDQVYGAKLAKPQQAEAKALRSRAKCEA